MNLKKFWDEIPKLPLSALIFYLCVLLFWWVGVIPSPSEIVLFLESLYINFGYFGLFIATFLEGIVYLGLYFPGSFIIALAVFFSDGSFFTLLTISIVVAAALTVTALVNYFLGRYVLIKERDKLIEKELDKGFFFSFLHPNILAFYFFNEGLEKKSPWKIVFIPFIMIPWGLACAYFLFSFAEVARSRLESPLFLGSLIVLWLVLAFVFEHRRNRKVRG
ncbi:hypothetical protein CMI41_02770 [Candidatus Pacearchaeota archaeon]|nr:hypothetical protein [Candidatus Pacearchaeota archaeon]